MKLFAIAFITILSVTAWSDTLSAIKTSKDRLLTQLIVSASETAKVIDKSYKGQGGGTVSAAYAVTKMRPLKNESQTAALTRNLKRALHHDYPITGDDGGYSFSILKNTSKEQTLRALDSHFTDNEDAKVQVNRLADLLTLATRNADLIVLIGNGSGNNTMASIVAVLNLKNSEIVYLMDSNFGSDN